MYYYPYFKDEETVREVKKSQRELVTGGANGQRQSVGLTRLGSQP